MMQIHHNVVAPAAARAVIMFASRLLTLALLCFGTATAVAAPAACIAPNPPDPATADVTQGSARLLAGLPPIGVHGQEISAMAFWIAHARAMDSAWRQTQDKRLALWRGFAARELDGLETARGALYYPFSGPDFLYAHTLFPRAPRYLLVGLEDPGSAPRWGSMNEAQAAASLTQLRESGASLMKLSFFLTNNMRRDLQRGKLKGVTPLLMAMAARSGFHVRAVDEVFLGDGGELCVGNPGAGQLRGIRLALAEPGATALRELVYLRVDLTDRALSATPQFERLVRGMGQGPVFLKAASYLLHKPYFSTARALALDRATLVLQDDSGIPYQAFAPAAWSGKFYGSYAQPIAKFRDWRQPALRQAYAKNARPLDSGIGYSHRSGTSNIQLFERKAARVTALVPTPR
jgi:hypothetical protein